MRLRRNRLIFWVLTRVSGCALEPPICVAREPAFAPRVHWRVIRPRPAAKLSAPVIGESLLQFGTRIHNERPVLSDRFADRPSLKQENFDAAVRRFDWNLGVSADLN